MRRTILITGVCSLMLVATTAGAAVSPTPVIATRLNEAHPAASADYIAWQQNSKAHPHHYNLYVQPVGGEAYKVNAAGTEATTGAIDGSTLVYSEWRDRQNSSDVKLFDLVAKTASDPPVGVNTKQWEYWPSLDGDWLLFGRLHLRSGDRDVILYNLATGEAQTLAHTVGWNRTLGPGQVSGTFAVWEKSVSKHDALVSDDVFVFDIASGTTTQIPNPNHKAQYSPSVTSTGTVYYVRSGWGCGLSVRLMSYPVEGPATTVVRLPDDVDSYSTYTVERPDGSTSVFYDPGECGGDPDIYEVNLP